MAQRVKIRPFEWAGLADNVLSALEKFPTEIAEARELDRQWQENKLNIDEGKEEIRETALAIAEDDQLRTQMAQVLGVEDDTTQVFNAYMNEFKNTLNKSDSKEFTRQFLDDQLAVINKSQGIIEDPMILGFLTQKARGSVNAKLGSEAYQKSMKAQETKAYNEAIAGAKTLQDYEKIEQEYGADGYDVRRDEGYKQAKSTEHAKWGIDFLTEYRKDFELGNIAQLKNAWIEKYGTEEGFDGAMGMFEDEQRYAKEAARAAALESKIERDAELARLEKVYKQDRNRKQKLDIARKKKMVETEYIGGGATLQQLIAEQKKIEGQIAKEKGKDSREQNKELIETLNHNLRVNKKLQGKAENGFVRADVMAETEEDEDVLFGALIDGMNAGTVDWTNPDSIQSALPAGWEVGPEKSGHITIFSTSGDKPGAIKYISKNGEILDEIPVPEAPATQTPTRAAPPIIPEGGQDVFGNTDRESDIRSALFQ